MGYKSSSKLRSSHKQATTQSQPKLRLFKYAPAPSINLHYRCEFHIAIALSYIRSITICATNAVPRRHISSVAAWPNNWTPPPSSFRMHTWTPNQTKIIITHEISWTTIKDFRKRQTLVLIQNAIWIIKTWTSPKFATIPKYHFTN